MKAFLLLLFTLPAAWAQTFTLEGFVFDAEDKPIVGAFVQAQHEGLYLNVSSDGEGYFTIAGVGADDSLMVSHTSYERVMLPVQNQKRMVVRLAVKPVALQTVSVVAYPRPPASLGSMFEDSFFFKGDSVIGRIFALPTDYPDGKMELIRFLAQTVTYPIEAAENKVEGTVEVTFVVNRRGYVRQPVIVKSLGYGCDEEVLKAVLSMPPFRPAIQNNQAVEMPFKLAINFSLKQNPVTAAAVQFPEGQRNSPIFIWNDTVFEDYLKLNGIHHSLIKDIEIIKGKVAIDRFGEHGRSGVVLITTN